MCTRSIALLALCFAPSLGCTPPHDLSPEVPVSVALSGVRTCEDPGQRAATRFDRKQAPEQPIDEANLVGGGMVIEDFDEDGWYDLFLPSEATTQLWWGIDGVNYDEQSASGLGGMDVTMGVGGSAVDYDADGDLDLYVTRWLADNRLLRNNGDRTFTDVTAAVGLAGFAKRSQSASWGDIDGDGDLDLFVGTYGEWTVVDVNEDVPTCEGEHIADASGLWENQGDGTFKDVSDRLPQEVHDGYVFASGWYDLNGDTLPELLVANDDGLCAPSVLLHNEGGRFSVDVGARFHPDAHDMGMAVGDLNGDELPDVVLTSWKAVSVLRSTANPNVPAGVTYVEAGAALGIGVAPAAPSNQVYGWGAEFGDLDNDADLDLAMMFGYWSTYDGAGDPARQRDGLWVQRDDGVFSDEAAGWGLADDLVSRSVILADLNRDGWLDLAKRQLNGPTPMYLSRCGTEGWLRIRLQDDTSPNRRAVGAKVRLISASGVQVRWVTSGSSGLFTGSPYEQHFGLGADDRVDRIEVVWPDGVTTVHPSVLSRQTVTLTRRGM